MKDRSALGSLRREHSGEESPELQAGRDAGAFFFGVSFVDVGAEGDHVETRIGLGDDAAFESGMAGADFDFVPKQIAVESAHGFEDGRGGAGAPAGVTGIVVNVGAY